MAGICAFGERHIRPHYTPLIGAEATDAQVRHWWNGTAIEREGFPVDRIEPSPTGDPGLGVVWRVGARPRN